MPFKQLLAFLFLLVSSQALEGPCTFKNVSLMSGVSQKPIVTPTNCGMVSVNASELSTKPNVIFHGSNPSLEKFECYAFILLETIPQIRDSFKLRWMVTNVTPFQRSLTANETSVQLLKYSPPTADNNQPTKYFLYIYKQNRTGSSNIDGPSYDEINAFAPQKWVTKNKQFIHDIVGGVEFTILPKRGLQPSPYPSSVPGYPSVPVPVPGINQPGGQHNYPGQQYPSQQYPGQQQHPGQQYPGQQQHPGQQYPAQPHPQPPPYNPVQPAHPPQPYPVNPAQGHPDNHQPTTINNYYGKVKQDGKKKNTAAGIFPFGILIASMASFSTFYY